MPSSTRAIEEAAKAILNREQQERLERAREQAVEELERQQYEQVREKAIASAKERLRSMNREPLDAAREKARVALDEYATAIDAYNDELAEIYAAMAPYMTPDSGITMSGSGHLTVQDVAGNREGVQRAVSDVAMEVVRSHVPRGVISLDYPED